MDYNQAVSILNRHIFFGEKSSLLTHVADHPERFIGLFRPTKPRSKLLQNLLQSHEIRFGDAIEELLKALLREMGYSVLPGNLVKVNGERLSLDQYFTNGSIYYFIEQKVRDDHDSTKKRGQIRNFESKLEILTGLHPEQLVGIMYFVDPDLEKNKNYYLQELTGLAKFYNVELHLFYGAEFFTHFGKKQMWDDLISWLTSWKKELPDLPELNFDLTPEESFTEIKSLPTSVWRRFVMNDRLWQEGIAEVLFRDGTTLQLVLAEFLQNPTKPYRILSDLLTNRLAVYYPN